MSGRNTTDIVGGALTAAAGGMLAYGSTRLTPPILRGRHAGSKCDPTRHWPPAGRLWRGGDDAGLHGRRRRHSPRAVTERNELQGKASTWRGMAAVGVTVFLSLALPILGLLPSMPIALALLMFIMAGTDRWPVVVLAALVLTAAVYGIFGLGLGVDIPLVPSQHA